MLKVACPSCKVLNSWENNPYRPFCSKECKDRDLGKWANEEYRVASEEEELGKDGVEEMSNRSRKRED